MERKYSDEAFWGKKALDRVKVQVGWWVLLQAGSMSVGGVCFVRSQKLNRLPSYAAHD